MSAAVPALVALIVLGLALDCARRAREAAEAVVVGGRRGDSRRHRLQQAEERVAVAGGDAAGRERGG